MSFDYTTLITPEHADKAKFKAWVALLTGALDSIATVVASMPSKFDVDLAVGEQLDFVGLWVGVSRVQVVSATAIGNAFSWNVLGKGWNEAYWYPPYVSTTTTVVLDDATYRALIKATIAGNYWTGTADDMARISADIAPSLGLTLQVIDNLDMTTRVRIVGAPSASLLRLVQIGKIPVHAAGVRVSHYMNTSVSGAWVAIAELTAPRPAYNFGTPQ